MRVFNEIFMLMISRQALSATNKNTTHCNFVYFTNLKKNGVWIDLTIKTILKDMHCPSIRYTIFIVGCEQALTVDKINNNYVLVTNINHLYSISML